MINYILTVLFDKLDDDNIQEVLDIVSFNMDGNEFMFDCIGTSVIVYFTYDGDHSELFNMFTDEFNTFSDGFVLTELIDDQVIMLSDPQKMEQLNIPKIEDEYDELTHDLQNFLYQTKLSRVMSKIEVYDMDTILDKINERGVESLTKGEIEYLNKLN
jgi:hypothetical protein